MSSAPLIDIAVVAVAILTALAHTDANKAGAKDYKQIIVELLTSAGSWWARAGREEHDVMLNSIKITSKNN